MSEKLRVYEVAKQLGVSTREVIWALGQLNVEVKNHMSTVDPAHIDGIKRALRIEVTKTEKAPEKVQQLEKPKPKEAPADSWQVQLLEKKQPLPKAGPEKPQIDFDVDKKPSTKLYGEDVLDLAVEELESWEKVRVAKRAEEKDLQIRRRAKASIKPHVLTADQTRTKRITIDGPITVGNFAQRLGVKPTEVIKKLISLGVMKGINQEIDAQTASLVAADFGFQVEEKIKKPEDEELLAETTTDAAPEQLLPRPPVVTVMGHVDHGKTSLLDAIRKTKVTEQEAGGITQHIGASTVELNGKQIVFIDTPGHESFTAMRARGAQVTDIAVLVVAADDGVMPQTVEAINHARAAGVPIVVAINKIDKPNANVDRVKQQLVEQGLIPEDWGGDTICVPVSARQKRGIEDLLEMILLVAEMQELKANYATQAKGVVIEARVDKGRGPVATVIIQEGTLKVGDPFVCGYSYGKVRTMFDDTGRQVRQAVPSSAVEVVGFSGVPEPGDTFQVVHDEKVAREVASIRLERRRQQEAEAPRFSLDKLFEMMQKGDIKALRIVLKTDVQGSIDAIMQALDQLENKAVGIEVVHAGVGSISESDVMLAAASNAIVVGFNVRPDANARKAAEKEKVDIRTYRVIYEVIEDIRKGMEGLLEPKLEEVLMGRAEVRQVFKIPKLGQVGGCYVSEGKVTRGSHVRVLRDGAVVYDGVVSSLKRFKDDVREVSEGYECGIGLDKFDDIKEGDILEFYTIEKVKQTIPV